MVGVAPPSETKTAGQGPAVSIGRWLGSEEAQHRLVGLRRQGEGGLRELPAGVQREEVRAFLVAVGEHEAVGAERAS